jgi:hypothetical protein
MLATLLAAVSLAIWLYLVFARGLFWLARERDDRDQPADPAVWPAVCAVVPARNEADVIARSIGGLLATTTATTAPPKPPGPRRGTSGARTGSR